MYNIVIDFDDAVKNYDKIIKYAGKYGDTFSVVATQRKPYLQRPPLCKEDEVIKSLKPYLVDYVVNAREWPNMKISGFNHYVLLIYKLTRECRRELEQLGNWFAPAPVTGLPFSICFYKNGKPWLCSDNYDNDEIWIEGATKEDEEFFKSNNIKFR